MPETFVATVHRFDRTPRSRPSLAPRAEGRLCYAKENMDSHWTHTFLRFCRLPAARYGQWKASRNSVEYEAPLRSELFSSEQMASHGTLL
ncbi:hypothetical protein, partial [Pseudomonas protegens]|uniref:hypothetical protein n=1 Tax=Pseudomonas protegens TaxID=380021 RepID=UPI00223BBB29